MNTENVREYKTTSENSNGLCRLCGRQDLTLINIFSEEGSENEISNKIEMYIPIKLVESKDQPLHCCLECINAILSWHDFILKVLETNKRLSVKNEISTPAGEDDNSVKRNILSATSTSIQALHRHSEIPENLPNTFNESEECYENIGTYECIEQSVNSSKESEGESDGQENEIELFKPDNHNDSDGEDQENEFKTKIRGIRNKIDPQIIDEAKVVVGDRTYYNCKECGKSLLSPYTYVWHMRIHTGERPFMCDLCGKQFRVSQGLVRHLKETHKRIKNFPCDLCGRMFATKRNVDEHRRIHTNERPYVCALCSKSFKQKASLFVHNRTHSDHFPFKCEYCNQGFRTKPPLLIHITKHTGQKPYPCDVCGRCFRIKYELKRHKLVHSEEKPFVCSSCGLRFKQKRTDHIPEDLNGSVGHFDQSTNGEDYKLNINTASEEICVQDDCEVVNIEFVRENTEPKHPTSKKSSKLRRKKCEVDNKFFCETCDKGFTRKFDMQRHKKLKHDEVDTNSEERRKNREIISKCRIHEDGKILYECYICQQRTNHSYNLMRHMNKHTGVKTYICHICGKTFRLDSSFRKHIKQFHEGVKNYKCEICDKTFGSRSARDEHLNTHSGHRPFACDICHKSFKQKSSLYVHKLYHEKNFKFECSLCDKKFRRAQELAVHDRMHSGQKPYSCDVCGVKFRRSQELKRHRKIHSANNIEWTCQICESTFTQERFLKLHRKVHAAPDT